MVIIVTGPAGPGRAAVGRDLAADLGWTFVDSEAWGDVWRSRLRAVAERTLGRREHLVLACPPLKAADRDDLSDLRSVRVISLEPPGTDPATPGHDVLRLNPALATAVLVRHIRQEIGH
jgi:gluconate kinase